MLTPQEHSDLVWKALGDSKRRLMLDVLAEQPQTTGELVARFPDLCRTNVMKHLDVLVSANLVIVRREGRMRWNHLNPVPIQQVCDRWVSRHVKSLASSMTRLKEHAESSDRRPKAKKTKTVRTTDNLTQRKAKT